MSRRRIRYWSYWNIRRQCITNGKGYDSKYSRFELTYWLILIVYQQIFVQNHTIYSLILLGFKMWGNEFNCDGSALEAGLEPFIRWNKKVCKEMQIYYRIQFALIDYYVIIFLLLNDSI